MWVLLKILVILIGITKLNNAIKFKDLYLTRFLTIWFAVFSYRLVRRCSLILLFNRPFHHNFCKSQKMGVPKIGNFHTMIPLSWRIFKAVLPVLPVFLTIGQERRDPLGSRPWPTRICKKKKFLSLRQKMTPRDFSL